jgi:CBS domain-containing protein
MLVRECLRSGPVTVPPTCTILEASEVMAKHGVGSLLVVSGDRFLGIVTDRDLVVRGVAGGLTPTHQIKPIVTENPVTIQGSADISEAFQVLKDAHSRRLPVLENGDLAGIITVDDLLVALLLELNAAMAPVARELLSPEIPG